VFEIRLPNLLAWLRGEAPEQSTIALRRRFAAQFSAD
jgi:hypothetical protein